MILAILCAFASALTIAWGTVMRHHTGPLQARWWAGLGGALAGYGLQILALSFGSLLIVQPILVLSLMLTLPLSAYLDGRPMSRAEILWSAILTLAVGVVVIGGRPIPGLSTPAASTWLTAAAVGLTVMGVLLALPLPRDRALILGTVTGGIYGYVALLSKAVVDRWPDVLHSWELYALLALALLGLIAQQASFNAGPLRNSLPAMTIVEPLVAFTLGWAVLGETFQISLLVIVPAIAVMVGATLRLSRLSID